jgi:L-malate glycosyltransferase
MGSVLSAGDAVTNHIIEINRRLMRWGFATDTFGADIAAAPAVGARPDSEYRPFLNHSDDVLLYHYSAYCENHTLFQASHNRKILIYHNITPSIFFRPYDPMYETLCRRGREVLGQLTACELAIGVSEYNRQELIDAGFAAERTAVLPLFLGVEDFRRKKRDESYYRRLKADGHANVLFVGRVAPNKAFEDLIKVFAVYHRYVNPTSRLILVGARFLPDYDRFLERLVARLGVSGSVIFTGRVRLSELRACYEAADLFLCASRHEGFCVPLLEAMSFHLPILARAEAAVPETLGDAGVLFHELDCPTVAELMDALMRDRVLRQRIVAGQNARLLYFAPANVEQRLREILAMIGVAVPPAAEG